MNREILFRGKRIDNGEWIKGDLITTPFIRNETQQNIIYILGVTKADYYCFEDLTEDNGIFEVDPATVCQYTGLKDETEKEIYEEDIVGTYSGYSEERDYAVVKYGEFNCSCCDGVYGWYFEGGDIRDVNLYKVCGNIYDNPEIPIAYDKDKIIEHQEKASWIPCSERLPEESLNSVIGWDEYRQRCCFVQYYGGRWIFGNDIESVKITAWQPLPEPYKS